MTGTVSVPWLVPGGGVAPPQMPHLRSGVMGSLSQSHSGSPGAAKTAAGVPRNGTRRGRSRGRWVFVGATLGAAGAAGVAYIRRGGDRSVDGVRLALGWGEGVERPDHTVVRTLDGAQLAVWDLEGGAADAPVVVLPHCWGCSHEVWLPVTRRLREEGYRVVLYDQRGHGASTRGTAPLTIETLAHDLTAVLDGTDVRDVVLAGHSMGGMTIMSLATHRPDGAQGARRRRRCWWRLRQQAWAAARRKGRGSPTHWWRRRSSRGRCGPRMVTFSSAVPSVRARSARTWI